MARNSSNAKHSRLLSILIACLGSIFTAEAHRLDECLQAALIELTPEEVKLQLNLNPGVQVAEPFIWMIDRDHDGCITAAEGQEYGKSLLDRLTVSFDQRRLKLEFVEASCDSISELREGTGNIRVEMRARLRGVRPGEHVLAFENRHQPELSVYLVNAVAAKFPWIRILKQERNDNQSVGRIYFSLVASSSKNWSTAPEILAGLLVAGSICLMARRISRLHPSSGKV